MVVKRTSTLALTLWALAFSVGCDGRLGLESEGPEEAKDMTPGGVIDQGSTRMDMGAVLDQGGPGPQEDMAQADQGGPVGPEPAPFDPVPAYVSLRAVKLNLTGDVPTEAEVSAVQADPQALKGLVAQWLETPEFKVKMLAFLTKTLQQDHTDIVDYGAQAQGRDVGATFRPPPAFRQSLNESMARTAWELMERGRPFHEIASTRTWQLTTTLMSFLALTDRYETTVARDRLVHRFYHTPFTDAEKDITFDERTPLAVQIRERTWFVPVSLEGCGDEPVNANAQNTVFSALTGGFRCTNNKSVNFYAQAHFGDSDHTDWRPVTLTTAQDEAERPDYWDVPKFRGKNTLALTIPRAGFYSSPAFLAKWRSNIDNSFRVTTNQSMIVGLGESFEDSDVTLPLKANNIATEHADPTTLCYACHSALDPMRNFFFNNFDPDTFHPLKAPAEVEPSFAFFGFTEAEANLTPKDLADLGQLIGMHPNFAKGWTQKLCTWANSQPCDERDAEFVRLVEVFKSSDFNLKTLIIELFSSPLVTGAARTKSHDTNEYITSITRQDHLCNLFDVRLGRKNVCGAGASLSESVPEDAWLRGSSTMLQPATSSLFYASTLEALCARVARLIDQPEFPVQSGDMEGSTRFIVEGFLGLAPSDPRHDMMLGVINEHLVEAAKITGSKKIQLESAFTLACTSPFITSTGF